MSKTQPHFCSHCGHVLTVLQRNMNDPTAENEFNYICSFCEKMYEYADIESAIQAYVQDNERLRYRNSNLSASLSKYQAQNVIMHETLMIALVFDGHTDELRQIIRDALNRISQTKKTVVTTTVSRHPDHTVIESKIMQVPNTDPS